MSRCFPFPLPGYEKKTRLDDVNLVIKEKHKQKKHKRDKEKKERSERKEKEKSEKDKEGEPKKEKKHRDKKHKKKDKHKSSEEKKSGGSFENQNGETLVQDIKPNDELHDSRILVESGKRIRNDEGAVDIRMAQKITAVDERKIKLLEKVELDNHVAGEYDDFRGKRELSRMDNSQYLKVDSRGLENGVIKIFSGQTEREVQNKVEDLSSKVVSFDRKKLEKEKNNQIIGGKGDRKKLEGRDESRKSEDKKRKEEKTESLNEPIKHRGSDNFREPDISTEESREFPGLPKRKEPRLNGFLHDNGIWPNNMSGPVSLSHQSSQNGSGSHPTQIITNLTVRKPAPTSNHQVTHNRLASKPVNRNVANGEPGQRPDYISDHGRATTSNSHVVNNGFTTSPLVGIGKSTEPGSTTNDSVKVEQRVIKAGDKFPTLQPWNEQGQDDETNIDGKHSKKSGILEAAKQHTSLSLKVKEKSGKSKKAKSDQSAKPPHPDLKYLDQILTIPKLDWPQFDDQEWLFGHRESPAKRPRLASFQPETTKEVWAEAMRLESADVIALPYVVPY